MLKKIVNFGNAKKFWKIFFLQSTHNDEQIKNLKKKFKNWFFDGAE